MLIPSKKKNTVTETSKIVFDQKSGYCGLATLTHTKAALWTLQGFELPKELILISYILALLLCLSRLHMSTLWSLSRPLTSGFICSTLTLHLHWYHLLILTSIPTSINFTPLFCQSYLLKKVPTHSAYIS